MTQEEKDLLFYYALVDAGVDNWDGYDDAREIYFDYLKEALKEKQVVQTDA